MNPVHLHLILNHIPLVGAGFVVLLFIIAMVLRSNQLINISLIFVIIVALWAIPVHQTGESAEEYVKGLPDYSEKIVLDHDIAADIAFISIELVGVLALITLIARRYYNKFGHVLTIVTLLCLIIGGGLLIRAAYLGGKIRHPELRQDSSALSAPSY